MAYNRSLELCARMNYETENLDFIDRIPAGEVFYDLGACEGRFSLYAALRGVRCFSFEPERRNFEALLQNVALNAVGEDRLRPFKVALGERAGQARLRIGQPWAGGHQKVVAHEEERPDLRFDFVEEETVEVRSLDQAIDEWGLPPPAFVKVDVDGSEVPFLRGARRTLSAPTLRGLIFELETRDPGYERILEDLRGSGLAESARYAVPNEPFLFNVVFARR